MRSPSRAPKSWRRGSAGRKSGAGRLALRGLSAGNEHRGRQHLRELLGYLARSVPEIEGHAPTPVAFEKAGDRRVAVGPVAGERLHARRLERVANLAAVDRRRLVDLASQAPVGGEIDEDRLALLHVLSSARFAPR